MTQREGTWLGKFVGFLVLGFFAATLSSTLSGADTPDDDDSWNDIVSDEKFLVFGRFVGKFGSRYFPGSLSRAARRTTPFLPSGRIRRI